MKKTNHLTWALTRSAVFIGLLALSGLAACGDDDGGGNGGGNDAGMTDTAGGDAGGDDASTTDASIDGRGDDASTGDASDEDAGGSEGCDTTGASDDLIVEGDYFLAVELESFAGLQIFFQANVVAGADSILSLSLRGVSSDKTFVSDPIATVCDVPVDAEGTFRIEIDSLIVPGQATPTGTDVELVDFVMLGEISETTSFCGDLEGQLPLLGQSLEGSKFKAVPWGTESSPPESSCEGGEVVTFDPIETCPDIEEGTTSMTSAELDREFMIDVPADYDGSTELPVVFLFHGLGQTGAEILDMTDFDAIVDDEQFILVVPEGANTEDGDEVFPTDWNTLSPRFDNDNQDIVFFDDMVTCIGEQYEIDSDRIYATGMSGGGLMTVFVSLSRAEVIAAAAPFSGGFTHDWPEDARALPFMVTWGGETDTAVDTNFHDLNTELLADLESNGHFAISCNHGTGHEWPSEMTAAAWAFLSAFTFGDESDPFGGTLPDAFPDYCEYAE